MKKFRGWMKKGAAIGLACAVTVTAVPLPDAVNAEEGQQQSTDGASAREDDGLILWYDFESLSTGTIVNDMSGNGHAGVVRPTGSQATASSVNIYGTDYTAYSMEGGQPSETNTYVELPSGVFNDLEDITVSCWVYLNASTGYQRIWDFGFKAGESDFNTTTYMYLIADGYNDGHTGYTAAITDGGWGDEKGPGKGEALATGEWVFTTVTFDGSEKEMSLYEDGVLIGTEKTDVDLSVLEGADNALIGYGQFKNDILSGMVADFKIYDYAMTADEVSEEFNIPDDEKVARDKEWLDLGDVTEVTEDLTLPVKGAAGSDISWESSDPDVISSDGSVTRPEAGEGDAEVILTATLQSGDVTDTKVFEVTVKQKLTPEEIVNGDAEALTLSGLAAVSDNLNLPSAGEYGSPITWESSEPDIIAADGKVTRPVGDPAEVILTATISYGALSVTKEFTATVVPVYEKNDIVATEDIAVETQPGTLPSLPGHVKVTYEDDTTGKEKVVWPVDLTVDQFATVGDSVEVTGQIVDYDVEVTATVTVTEEAAKDLGLWVYRRLSGCTTEEQREQMWSMYIAGEYGGMNESLATLYEITGEEEYLEAAQMFDNSTFFDNLAANVDDVADRHANQHIPQIVGAIHEYAATGDSYYYNVAENFWEIVTDRYAYSIGGVGTGETFKDPYTQGQNILGNESRGENCETCAAYNMLKLTQQLYNYDPDNAEYMDYYERTLINQIAASQSHDTTEYMHNGTTYMLPIDPGQSKDYDTDYGGFTCCNGTGMENHVKYQAAAYAKSDDTLYVNLYMPTTVTWDEMGVSVKQETDFPSEHSKLTVTGSGEFTIKLRVPYWATDGFEVRVNGETICTNPEVSTYVEITRTWESGDVITINMPYTLHLDKTPDEVDGSTVASLMYGPLVMVAKDDRDTYEPMNWYTLVLSDDLEESVTVITGTDEEDVPHLSTNGLDFYPMYDAYNYRYHAYVKVEDTESVVNKDELQNLLDAVTTGGDIPNEEDYTADQWLILQQAIEDAQAVLENEDATQTEVYNAYKALQEAENALILVSDAEKPGTDEDYSDTSGAEEENSNSSGSVTEENRNSESAGAEKTAAAVRTGDLSPIGTVFAVMAVSAVMAGAVICLKKRKNCNV